MPKPPTPPSAGLTRVWDLPTRVFHWLLAATIIGSLATGYIGDEWLPWHMRCGYVAFALLIFRVAWGFVGGHWSRFATFFYGPGTVLRYVRGQARPDELFDIGHSPLGGLSVFGLLVLLAIQVGTGLVADDDVSTTGPLNRFVSNASATQATAWHADIGQWILLAMVVLHVGAIAFYYLRRGKNLVRPMITGDKALPLPAPAAVDSAGSRALALLIAALAAVVVGWVVSLGG